MNADELSMNMDQLVKRLEAELELVKSAKRALTGEKKRGRPRSRRPAVSDEPLMSVVDHCRQGEGSLDDYRACFEFADDALRGFQRRTAEGLGGITIPHPQINL